MVEHICNNCWKSIKQFDEFCDAIRNVHGFTQVYVENTKEESIDEHIEYVEEELEENIDMSTELSIKSILSIEKDVEKNVSSLARRPGQFNVLNSVDFLFANQ